jgi:hypothetical protein
MPSVVAEPTALDKANRARRYYAAERYLRRVLDAPPFLTPEMRRALAALLLADAELDEVEQ